MVATVMRLPPSSIRDTLPEAIRTLAAGFSVEIAVQEVPAFVERPDSLPAGLEVFVPARPDQTTAHMIDACARLDAAGVTPVPHLAARAFARRADLEALLEVLGTRIGVEKVMLVGGDQDHPQGPFACALDILATGLLSKYGVREVVVAGYPDGHRAVSNPQLRAALSEKIATGRSMGLAVGIVTQFSFEPDNIAAWCMHAAQAHADLPVTIGLPGPARLGTLSRYATRCGVPGALRALSVFRSSAAEMLAPVAPDHQMVAVAKLMRAGRHYRVHLFSFGNVMQSLNWMTAVQEGRFEMSADGLGFTPV